MGFVSHTFSKVNSKMFLDDFAPTVRSTPCEFVFVNRHPEQDPANNDRIDFLLNVRFKMANGKRAILGEEDQFHSKIK